MSGIWIASKVVVMNMTTATANLMKQEGCQEGTTQNRT